MTLDGYTPGTTPSPDLVRAARRAAGQTQGEAAAEVYWRRWQSWQECESGRRNMQAAVFELYCRKHGLWGSVAA